MRRVLILSWILFLSLTALAAGDRAEFVNLGFSPNGNYFMFGFYGYDAGLHRSYSEIYTVDVERNLFVPKGVSKGSYDYTVVPGQSVEGALFTLLEENADVRTSYSIQYLETGRPVYIRIDDNPDSLDNLETDENLGMNNLEFNDFVTGDHYTLTLNQTMDEGTPVRSTFSLGLSVRSSDGLLQTYNIGHPNYKRSGVDKYNIDRVLVGPDNRSVVIIIAKFYDDGNIRYMVETVKLK
jgi:predicted secreted protein